jgi:hypothetical protein
MTSFGRDIHVLHIHTETIQGFHDESTNQRVNDIGVHLLNEVIEIGESNNINLKTLNLKNNPDDVERYSIGLSNSNFVLRDNLNEVDKITIDKTTGVITFNPPLTAQSSISNLVQLQDVITSGITDGNILVYNQSTNNFEFQTNTATQSNLATCNFIEDLSLNVATNTSGILTNQTNITSNSNYMVSLSNQQDTNTTNILNHSNLISNIFTPYLGLNDPSLWQFKSNVLMKQTLTLCNDLYLSNTPVSNDTQFNLLAIDDNTKRVFSTSNFTSQVNSNKDQILINTSNILSNSLSITNLTSSNSDLCNRIDNIVTSSNYSDITASNSQSNVSLCNLADLNSQSNSNLCNYITNLVISNYDNITSSNSQSNLINYNNIVNNDNDIDDLNIKYDNLSQSNSNLCNLADLNSQSNSNLCNYITNLVISNYDDITSSNSQSNSNLCNYITNLVISNYDDITSSNSQSNSNLCNLADLNSQSNSNLCNYITNLVISNYDDITSSNSQSNSNLCNYITNLVISNYDDITSSNSQSNVSLCNLADLNSQSNSNLCNYITNLVISNYDDITSSNSQSNVSLCNLADLNSQSNSNLCNYITNLVISNYDDITSSNSQSNSNLCNLADLNSQSNSNLCNYITNLVISNYDDITSSNSQSNLYLCNHIYINPSTNGFGLGDCNFETSSNGTDANSTAIGSEAARYNAYNQITAIGNFAGRCNMGFSSVALGAFAGRDNLGDYSLAIGYNAAKLGSCNNTIILSAEAADLNPGSTGFFVSPVTECNVLCNYYLQYNSNTKEISYASNCNLGIINYDAITSSNSQSNSNMCNDIVLTQTLTHFTQNTAYCNSLSNIDLCNKVDLTNTHLYINPGSNNYGYGLCNFKSFNSASSNTTALGYKANESNPQIEVTSIGAFAGSTRAKNYSTNIGAYAGDFDANIGSTNVGYGAGSELSGEYSIAIGHKAGYLGSCNNSIIMNASATVFHPSTTGLFINPITESNVLCNHILQYNSVTKEITFTSNCNLPSGGTNYDAITQSNSQSNSNLCNQVVSALDLAVVNAGKIFLNSQSNLSLCNNIDSLSQSNSNLCNQVVSALDLAVVNAGKIFLNSQSNLSLCNNIDSLSQSNSNLCNNIDSLSQSNSNLCNDVTSLNSSLVYNTTSNLYALGKDNFGILDSTAFESVALGHQAAANIPSFQTISIGSYSGNSNASLGAISIGHSAGRTNAGIYSICIGLNAGRDGTCNSTIVLNATGTNFTPSTTGFFVNPITESNVLCNHILQYNSVTKEISYTSNCNLSSNAIILSNSQSNSNLCNQINSLSQSNVSLCNTQDVHTSYIASTSALALSNSQSNSNLFNPIEASYSNFYDDSNAGMLYNFETKGFSYSKNRFSKFILNSITNITTTVSQFPITSRQYGSFTFTSAGVVTIPETGLYRVTASSLNEQASGSQRSEITVYLYVNGVENTETNGACYIRNQTGCENGSCHYNNIVLLNQNDDVTIRTAKTDTSGLGVTINALRGVLILERLN